MAKRTRATHFHEPWVKTQRKIGGTRPFADGIPPEADHDACDRALDGFDRAQENAEWVIWGSRMAEPTIVRSLITGDPSVACDRRIIAIQRQLGLPDAAATAEEFAERIISCVNAFRGIADPGRFIEEVRDYLGALATGDCEDPREDPRTISLLGRCIKPNDECEI